ncbi:uncharacterized protein LOC113238961 isoform X2 [Hyposmocoma kahamanoa]|nr:uncharacterized protein LOC113238961 isoform X2 [Hyposmocoma kahamanoa]
MSNSGDDSHGSHNGQRNKYWPVSTEERKGWRKWHRKCKPCPDVLHKQWSDPTIEWICGAYQRARRTFKSECMMHHRNCQDGTMFVKIYDRRCKDDETGRFGAHFFYEYDVKSTEEKDGEASNMNEELSTYEEERRALKRRAGVSVPSVRTTNSSIAMDPQNASNNVTTTNVNILTEVVNPTSKILQIKRYSRKVRDGNARRLTSNSTSAYYRNKVVKDFATYNHHSSRSAKLKSVANVTRRMYSYNGGLDKAIRAVSNFGLSLLEFTAHYNSVGHTELAVQHLKPQKNKHNRITTDHVKSTSPNFSSPRTTLVHSYPSSP